MFYNLGEWTAYDPIEGEMYTHEVVIHEVNFIDTKYLKKTKWKH